MSILTIRYSYTAYLAFSPGVIEQRYLSSGARRLNHQHNYAYTKYRESKSHTVWRYKHPRLTAT